MNQTLRPLNNFKIIVDKLNVNKLETVSCWFGKVK